ncbi:hypothetical protein RRG08_036789 [Elysia crispata]|uniref:Uncharacterized protein n=1 Tax=Elysia crispata TaxID=231223 RepID=A0AAE1ACU8_9GAST|nr:hypothetical protein RRG08_036789 [Elysia crispata]
MRDKTGAFLFPRINSYNYQHAVCDRSSYTEYKPLICVSLLEDLSDGFTVSGFLVLDVIDNFDDSYKLCRISGEGSLVGQPPAVGTQLETMKHQTRIICIDFSRTVPEHSTEIAVVLLLPTDETYCLEIASIEHEAFSCLSEDDIG